MSMRLLVSKLKSTISKNRSFDGERWQPVSTTLDAKLLNQHGLLTEWELPIDLSAIGEGESISVRVRSRNKKGRSLGHRDGRIPGRFG